MTLFALSLVARFWTLLLIYVFSVILLSLVLVTDGGTPSFSSSTTIICTVLDENDNTPELSLPEAEIHVPENQAPGIIHNVLATDKDTGNNGRVHFQIIGN